MRPLLRVALAASLAAAGGLALWPADDDTAVVRPARPRVPARVAGTHPGPAPVGAPPADPPPARTAPAGLATTGTGLPARPADWPAPGAAALAAWQGAAPPQAVDRPAATAAAPVRAAAAPFPYQWIGQLDDGAAPQLLLASAQRSVGVRLGEVLDGRWRLAHDAAGVLQATALDGSGAQPVRGAPPRRAPAPS